MDVNEEVLLLRGLLLKARTQHILLGDHLHAPEGSEKPESLSCDYCQDFWDELDAAFKEAFDKGMHL